MISNDAAALARDLDRAVDALRRIGLRPVGADASAAAASAAALVPTAQAAHRLAQALADAAADAVGEPRRPVPRLRDHALADQVAVTGRELLDALAAGHPADLSAVAAALDDLRRHTP